MNRALVLGSVAALLLGGAVFGAVAGCSSSPSPAPSGGPPVPDPGGPFQPSVSADRSLESLTTAEADTLCRDIAGAYFSFLTGAVQTDQLCRMTVNAVTSDALRTSDGGFDASGFCADYYVECTRMVPPVDPFFCPIPIGRWPASCAATVRDVSACLNEMAALDPIGRCVNVPGCARDASADAGAPAPSAMPACERLYRICPAIRGGGTVFPC
jgi:hypothetical protein